MIPTSYAYLQVFHGCGAQRFHIRFLSLRYNRRMDTHHIEEKHRQLIEMDDAEEVVRVIKKHRIGLIGLYVVGLGIAFIMLVTSVTAGLWLDDQQAVQLPISASLVLTLVGVVLAALVTVFTYVAGYIYQNNVIIVTSDKVVQILYRSIVDRKISQVSLGDLQDVTAEQRGFVARIFKYGTLVIETAGEQNNYNFTFAPFPYECAKDIVSARELSIQKYGN